MGRRGTAAALRPLKVVLYAALIGLLLASYVSPLQEIAAVKVEISGLRSDLGQLRKENASDRRTVEELGTREGIERVARERYGMIKPGEEVFIVRGGGR